MEILHSDYIVDASLSLAHDTHQTAATTNKARCKKRRNWANALRDGLRYTTFVYCYIGRAFIDSQKKIK